MSPGPASELFRTRVESFAERHVHPHLARWESDRGAPLSLFASLASEDFLAACEPGRPDAFTNKRHLAEVLGCQRGLGVAAMVLSHLNAPLWLVYNHAEAGIREKTLAGMIDGTLVGALGITEPTGGTDIVNAISTRIDEAGDELVVTGEKTYVMNVPGAHFVIVLGRSADRKDALGLSFVLVPTNAEGVSSTRISTSGMRCAPIGHLLFRGVRVPRNHQIGKLHRGLVYLQESLSEERLVGSAASVALARAVLEETVRAALGRTMYGGTQADLQTVRHTLADCEADLVLGEALLDRASTEWSSRAPTAQISIAMAKLYCAEHSERVVERCAQLAGASGYLVDSPVAQAYRDIRAASIFAGTSEAMRQVIADRLRL